MKDDFKKVEVLDKIENTKENIDPWDYVYMKLLYILFDKKYKIESPRCIKLDVPWEASLKKKK